MQLTMSNLSDACRRFNTAAGAVTDKSQQSEMREVMEELEHAFEQFEKKGKFDDDTRFASIYQRGEQVAAELEEQRDTIFLAHAALAKQALEILQFTLPSLEALAKDALQLAGKDAVRAVCAPVQNHAEKMIPSRYALPDSHESALSKVKKAVGI